MKNIFKAFIGMLFLVIFLAVFFGTYVTVYLPQVSTVPDITIEPTSERIDRGKYLANHVTVCIDCHSTRDWTLYSAPLVGDIGGGGEKFGREMGFPGVIYSKNITPYNLESWSDGEIFRAITEGVNKEGKALFSVMPYHNYGNMDKEDIYSIIAYIRTLDPIESDMVERVLDFPVNILVNTMPKKSSFTKIPDESDKISYGAYLINAAGCVHCHSQTEKGSAIKGTEFGGGMEFVQPAGIVRGANITMHKINGIGNWTKDAFIQRFKHYIDSNFVFPKLTPKDLNTPMPWYMYAGMRESDLEAIYEYLKSIPHKDNQVVKFEYFK